MGKQVWRGEHLWNLLNLTIKELQELYPDYSKGGLKSKKQYWSTKLKEGKIQMPPSPEREPTPQQGQLQGRLYKTWETSAYDKEKQEWVTTTNHGYEYKPNPEDIADVYEPATPAKITPTKRKRAEKLGKQILVFGDSQIGYHRVYDEDGNDSLIPTHSEEALSIVAQINAHERPDYVVNVSDTVDLAEFGRFDPQSDSFHRTLSPAFQRAHDLYAQLRADNPDAELIEVDSNHTQRVHKNIMKKMPEMYGFRLPGEDYPLMSYYRLANLGQLGVKFISGYGGAEYIHGEEYGAPIVFKHGTHSSSSAGATVKKEMQQNPTTHVVRGHGHSYEHVTKTTRDGKVLHYIQLGTTCETTGAVPSYHSSMDDFGKPVHNQENWQQQAMMITDYQDGRYQFNVIDIVQGIATYNNREYRGE